MQQSDVHWLPADDWRLVTDHVMGGRSTGSMLRSEHGGRSCVRLQGGVSTANSGGFLQLALGIDTQQAHAAEAYQGVRAVVAGNGERYNMHLRTRDLSLPWQSYRSSFIAMPEWQALDLPFDDFERYKTSSALSIESLKRIGLVAIGRDFTADLCVSALGFYR